MSKEISNDENLKIEDDFLEILGSGGRQKQRVSSQVESGKTRVEVLITKIPNNKKNNPSYFMDI